MIIKLSDAQAIDLAIKQEHLDAFEQAVRALTNNNFQDTNVRARSLQFAAKTISIQNGHTTGLRIGDTVEINDSLYNNGLYTIGALTNSTITVDSTRDFIAETAPNAIVTRVNYPADVLTGVQKLIQYDKSMAHKAGIKSETISRMSVTYYDVNAAENTDGYPAALLSFLKKYRKMRW